MGRRLTSWFAICALLTALVVLAVLGVTASAGGAAAEGHRGGTWTYDRYHTWLEVEPELRNLTRDHPDIAVLYDLGELYPNGDGSTKTSWEGRHFWAVKVSDNPTVDEPDEPKVLYVGMHHAREWMTVEMMMYLLGTILEGYGPNATITDLVDSREMWFFPVLNPDGYSYSITDDRMWRKNRRDNGDGTHGVDPNRNYAYAFAYDNTGSSPQTSQETYRGPRAFSEPCTQIMRDLAGDVPFSGAISLHTYQDVILFPVSHKRSHAPHYPLMKELSRRMAAHNGYAYGDVKDGILYVANGEWGDWMYHNTSCISFTFEMNSAADGGFDPPPELIMPTLAENYEPCILLAEYADDYYGMFASGVMGTVVDPREEPIDNASVHVALLGGDTLEFVTGPDGSFSFHAPKDLFYRVRVSRVGYTTAQEDVQVLWRDRLTEATLTIRDNVPPVIARVVASHEGETGESFGIGHQVRIDVYEGANESGLEGVVTVQSVEVQYFQRRRPLAWDPATESYFWVWDTSGTKPRSDYLVTSELWDIDDNRDRDGVVTGQPDLTLELRDITPPMVPRNLTVEAPPEGGSLVVSWEANGDDTQAYTLERRTGEEGSWRLLINLTREDAEFVDLGLVNGRDYFYRLMAWDRVPLASGWSQVAHGVPRDTVPPGEVADLAISAPSEGGSLVLSWTESSDDTSEYAIYRDEGPGFQELYAAPRGVTAYVDQDVVNERTYHYRVAGRDSSGNEGRPTPPVLGLPRDTVPPAMPVVGPLPDLTNQREHVVHGSAEANATVVALVDRQPSVEIPVGDDGNFSGVIVLESGTNRVQFRTEDPSGNPSGQTPEVIVLVDLRPPELTSTQPVNGQRGVKVQEQVLVVLSEGLVEETVQVRLLLQRKGVEVPSTHDYSPVSKSVSIYPVNQLEMGTTYRVVVNGSDAAGNWLRDGSFEFTTEEAEVEEPVLSTSTLLFILLAVVVASAGALAFLRLRRRAGAKGPAFQDRAADQPRRPQAPEGPGGEVYDPSPRAHQGMYTDDEWREY